MLVRDDIDVTPDAFDSIPNTKCEIIWAQIKLPNTKLLNIASAYRPPNSKPEYIEQLHEHMCLIYSKFKKANYIIGGDFNLTCINWHNGCLSTTPDRGTNDKSQCEQFLNFTNEFGLSQHSLEVTREISNKTLDLLLTNIPGLVQECTSKPGMSDHSLVLATLKLKPSKIKRPQRKINLYHKADWKEIKKDLTNATAKYFDRCPNNMTVEENATFIETAIRTAIEKFVPNKLSKTKQTYPWINSKIRTSMRRRDKAYIKAVKSHSPHDWVKFRAIRQATKTLIRENHSQYINTMINDNLKEDPKPFWSYIKCLRKDSNIIPVLNSQTNNPAKDDKEKATALQKQFISVFTKEDMETIPAPSQNCPNMPPITFGIEGITKLFQKQKANKAGGPDDVPAQIIRECAHELAPLYQHLYQQSYDTGKLPTSWTHARVSPIYKKGQRSVPENYRPVSLTSIPCKLMEHIVSQTWDHLNKYNIVTPNQHGFRAGMSCETQLIETTFDWSTILNKGGAQVDIILLDFSKAFDVVPHR